METTWSIKKFNDLTPHELYAILQLRNEVFVVEQNCVFQDADNKDPLCWHVMAWQMGILAGYTRLVPAGISYDEPSIGRVVTSPSVRGKGLGRVLMKHSIHSLYDIFGKTPIRIGAQLYLKSFYGSLGFIPCSEEYLEDGIPHMSMILRVQP